MRSIVLPVKFSVLRSLDDSERTYAVSIQIWSLVILPPQDEPIFVEMMQEQLGLASKRDSLAEYL